MNCKVTVLMAEHKTKTEYLKKAIDSILDQTYSNFKFLIIDDCTSEENKKLLNSYSDSRITIIENEKNIGLEYSLNKGLDLIDTEYVVRMDTDDIAIKNRIEKQVEFIRKNQQYSIISTNMNVFDDKGIYKTTKLEGEVSKERLIRGTPFAHPTMLIKVKDIKKIGGYPLYNRCEDYAMAMNMYAHGFKGYVMEEVLLEYRMDKDGYKKKKFKHRLTELKIRFIFYKKMKIKLYQYIYCLKPILVGMIPKKLLAKHQRKSK